MVDVIATQHLTIGFGATRVVHRLSFSIAAGEVVALVGESGSGKSTVALSLMGLLGRSASVEGSIHLSRKNGETCDLLTLPERRLRAIRGNDLAMIFQEPMASLDPIYRIGAQITEALAVHRPMPQAALRTEALRLLRSVAIANPEACLSAYPHQLSGGQRQRVMIAIALSCQPRLLIADEPTTALDATIQAQIIDQLRQLRAETGMAVLFITHDLGLVREIADRVLVMYAGRIVESGPTEAVFGAPRMPYTAGLMRSRPRLFAETPVRIEPIPGNVPNPAHLPPGCAFHPRCAHSQPGRCDSGTPEPEACAPGHQVCCLRWREIVA